ncbi:MAG: hypothetical protein A2493_02695 [Candidatus Magasanikbacteria bacterium RIFOXYC12_FULL_33_11]|uniref:Na+/H+ antiporter n=1 Tax=Candidatus Magasanikbacteria bacterium RIFOXYC12_FULL_33_11 TaxID=1798701 RepID=A0A1F6NRJ4_9BACT|nr:MAG: hypothetical protein A2493_02695 [Candidatus Magasanikbacteria bacterium RIFOXYC12_FULL_33_11]
MSSLEMLATVLFGLAILHTFSVKRFEHLAKRYPEGSIGENTFHLLGEVEVVFGFWASLMLIGLAIIHGSHEAVNYLEGEFILPGANEPIHVEFTEPLFVMVIMAISATRPILQFTSMFIELFAKLIPLPKGMRFFIAALVIGPLLGSFITEPAAMTVTALLLKKRFYDKGISKKLMYATIAVLFVNVSIGGTLTNFAAPPVLMVAQKFHLTIGMMLTHFGWKAATAVLINAFAVAWIFRHELIALFEKKADTTAEATAEKKVPIWLIAIHILLMEGVVYFNHHTIVFFLIFLLFLGVTEVTNEYQDELKLREALLVGYFLMGLVILGGLQRWWLEPTIGSLSELPLYLGATGLTAITDNAALTYLGSLVPNLSEASQYALVAGAVTGGGLTVIANAPNPAGFGILKSSFGDEGISPITLFVSGLLPTLVAGLCLWLLPHLG